LFMINAFLLLIRMVGFVFNCIFSFIMGCIVKIIDVLESNI
jgi:hypothetical protein